MSRRVGSRVIVGGVLWAAAYNSVWGIAWFAFMRREWLRASSAIDQALPWTPAFWAFWLPSTVVIGIAIMAYVASRPDRNHIITSSIAAGLVFWVPATVGMAGWAWHESLPARTVVLDTGINLVALVAAGLAGMWVASRR